MTRESRRPSRLQSPSLRFLEEKRGASELVLKERLVGVFAECPEVERAYLALVVHGRQAGVALCIRGSHGASQVTVDRIADVFARIFDTREYLDVIFLDEAQEATLRRVCRPFFDQDGP